MKFKCLLEILKEKDLIDIELSYIDKEPMFMHIIAKYSNMNLYKKILDNIPENAGYYKDNKTITIVTIEDIETWCLKQINDDFYNEFKTIKTMRLIFNKNQLHALLNAIKKSNRIEIHDVLGSPNNNMEIIDLIAKERYEKKQEEKNKEIDDFINSLP